MQFDQQIQSTVPTGVAPFTVASTTVVTNLNANFLNGYGPSAFAWASHTHPASQISNATSAGISLLTAADAEEQRRSLEISDLSGTPTVDIEAVAYHRTRVNSGGATSTRRGLNLIQGSGVSLSIGDDPASDETDVTISATSVGGNGDSRHTDYTTTDYSWPVTGGIVICNCTGGSIMLTLPAAPANGTIFTAVRSDGNGLAVAYVPGASENLDTPSQKKTWVYSSATSSYHKIVDID